MLMETTPASVHPLPAGTQAYAVWLGDNGYDLDGPWPALFIAFAPMTSSHLDAGGNPGPWLFLQSAWRDWWQLGEETFWSEGEAIQKVNEERAKDEERIKRLHPMS